MRTVLIVDDAAFMRSMLRNMLENNGYRVVDEAEDGTVGVWKYNQHRPDLVTLDITMPKMDGIEALQNIRKMNPNAKVVMVSAMGQEKIILEAVAAGAQAFIVKPFKEDHVINTLEKVLST